MESNAFQWTSVRDIFVHNKSNYSCNLEDRQTDGISNMFLISLIYYKGRFHVAMNLFCKRSLRTSKRGAQEHW